MSKNGLSYASRNRNLALLGFRSYADYLKSDLWRKIRAKVFLVKGRACWICGEYATQVHHNRYHRNDLLGKRLRFLNPICGKCHETIEFRGDDSKATVKQAGKAFEQLRARFSEQRRNIEQTHHLCRLLLNFEAD